MQTRQRRCSTKPKYLTFQTVRWLLAVTTLLELAACAPDLATAPVTRSREAIAVATDVAVATEQLLYQQPPLRFTSMFTGGGAGEAAAVDFVVPAGGKWRVSRFVLVGQGFQPNPLVGEFQIDVFEDNGSGQPGDLVANSLSGVPDGTPNPCCGGEVFDYSRPFRVDLAPGRYWMTNRLALSTRTFNPQLAVTVGYPGLVGHAFPPTWSSVPGTPPNTDFAFSVYGTVETPAEAAADLLTTIEGFGFPNGTFTSLAAKLAALQAALDQGDNDAACRALQDLINATSAQSGKKLTEAQANAIIDDATRIRGIVGC